MIRASHLRQEYKDAITEGLAVVLDKSTYNTAEEVLANLLRAIVLPRASVKDLSDHIHQNMPKREQGQERPLVHVGVRDTFAMMVVVRAGPRATSGVNNKKT